MMRAFTGFACIDWSGARGEGLKGIAVAQCWNGTEPPRLVQAPDRYWSRQSALDWVLANAETDLLLGVDFSAALPFADSGAFFPGLADSPADARALWRQVDALCVDDPHLGAGSYIRDARLAPYFRDGAITGVCFASSDPACTNGRLRRVEREVASGRPASCFNLVGASQVGKSSLTGMRMLNRLAGRVAIWPFDSVPDAGAVLVEIYTSIAARAAGVRGGTKMRSYDRLDAALAAIGSAPTDGSGPIDDHSADAILTAAWLRANAARPELWSPPRLHAPPAVAQTEGWTFGVP